MIHPSDPVPPQTRGKARAVSFSGIDGAGKSTQIEMLIASFHAAGLRVKVLTFWDDVAVLSRFREKGSLALFKGDGGIGSPDRPIQRRDKNVTAWPVRLMRLGLYFLDAMHLRMVVAQSLSSDADIVIFDRYIYDELANLPLDRWYARNYSRLILKLTPHPDVAYILDADPALALDRKPEYPIDFLQLNRASYLSLSKLASNVKVIAPSSIDRVHNAIVEEATKELHYGDHQLATALTASQA